MYQLYVGTDHKGAEFIGNKLTHSITHSLTYSPLYISTEVHSINRVCREIWLVFHDFPGENYFIFQSFQGILYLFV